MTKVGKILVVFLFVSGIAFLGFTMTTLAGGKNWQSETLKLEDYDFTQTKGETTSWSVTSKRSDKILKKSIVLPEVILSARNDLAKKQKANITSLQEKIKQINQEQQATERFIQEELASLKNKVDQLNQNITTLRTEQDQIVSNSRRVSQDNQELQRQIKRRREEIFLLKNLLEEMRTDRFQISDQIQSISEQLIYIEGNINQLENRKKQLESQGTKPKYES